MSAMWTVAVPVKRLSTAKSRMAGIGSGVRADLVLAMLADVLTAAADCASVSRCLLVTSDPDAVDLGTRFGAAVLSQADDGINAAFALARDSVGAGPLALLMADLPCLDPTELSSALDLVPPGRPAVVGDAAGTGTVLLAARDARLLRPEFGPDSRARHVAAGAVDLTERAHPSLRWDVDTWAAVDEPPVPLGANTRTWLARHLDRAS